jgi:tetratricopeptide (TPR) repeat protein/DNA-binding CsgD family transcriptional regulator
MMTAKRNAHFSIALQKASDDASLWKLCYSNPSEILQSIDASLAKQATDSVARAFMLQAKAFALFLVGKLDAAQTIYDDVEKRFRRADSDDGLACIFAMKGFLHERQGDMKSALHWHLKSVQKSRSCEAKSIEAFALLGIGNLYGRTGFVDKASSYYRQCWSLSRAIGDARLEAAAQMGLGIVQLQQGNVAEALKCHHDSLKRFSELGDKWSQANAMQNIGQAYCVKGEFQKGLKWHRAALGLKSEIGDTSGVREAWWNLALIYRELNRASAELRAFETLLALDAQSQNKLNHLKTLIALGELHFRNHDFKRAFQSFQKSLDIAREIKDREEEAAILFTLGTYYHQQNQAPRAESAWLDALELAEKFSFPRLSHQISEMLSEFYERRGNISQALYYYKRFNKQKIAVMNAESKQRLEHIETMLEMESLKRQAELTKQKAKHFELDASQKSAELARLGSVLLEHHQTLLSLSEELKKIASRVSGKKAKDNQLRALIANLDKRIAEDSRLSEYSHVFHQLHPNFFSTLSRRYPQLSTTELMVCSLVCLGLSSKEIAKIFYASDSKGARFKNIEKHRVRIRKKLGLARDHQLASFLASLSSPNHTP